MKRMIKIAFLSSFFLIASLVFPQSMYACGGGSCCSSCCPTGCCPTCCSSCCPSERCWSGPVHCFKTYSCQRDCCTGCNYKVVTYWKSYCVRYKGVKCECGCPKCYTYAKQYSYPVKTVKYHLNPSPCATCCN
jgi:hypothetical protein